FRFILFSPLRLGVWARVFNPLPLAAVGVLLMLKIMREKKVSWNPLATVFSFLFISAGIISLSQILFTEIPFRHVLLPRLSSVQVILFFPLCLALLEFSAQECFRLLQKLSFFIIWGGGLFAITSFFLTYFEVASV